MKASRLTLLRYTLTIFVAVCMLLVAAPGVSANVRIERGGDVPFYARLERGAIYHTNDWAAVVFYRPPECVRPDFNLLDFFDIPAAFSCVSPTTAGFEIWENGLGIDFAPKMTELFGLGAVPVWFVSWTALEAAVADDVLTIEELASLDRLVGTASAYHETLRPSPTGELLSIEFNATGTLADGRTFQLNAIGNDRFLNTRIVFR